MRVAFIAISATLVLRLAVMNHEYFRHILYEGLEQKPTEVTKTLATGPQYVAKYAKRAQSVAASGRARLRPLAGPGDARFFHEETMDGRAGLRQTQHPRCTSEIDRENGT